MPNNKRDELIDLIYEHLKDIQDKENIRLSSKGYIAETTADRVREWMKPQLEQAVQEERKAIGKWLKDSCFYQGKFLITGEQLDRLLNGEGV